jgi:hypothetical protein
MPRRAQLGAQLKKLASAEEDWNLAGGLQSEVATTRTRGGAPDESSVAADDEADDLSESEDGDEEASSEEESVSPKKPPHTRVVLEVSQLQKAFAGHVCPDCNEPLELKLRTVCIATSIQFICNNEDCNYKCDLDKPSRTTMHEDDKSKAYERMTDYCANVLYVIGLISVGDGATEAGRLLGLMGLPNDTTMMNRSFGIIEERIGHFVREMCESIIKDNIDQEAKASMNEFDYNVWKMWLADPTLGPLPVERMPHLDATYDMAWQQKGSGHQYNSQSGHGTLFGRHTRKTIGLVIKSKLCSFCNTFTKKNPGVEVPPHDCWKNHDGSSSSMESSGAVDVIVEAFEKRHVVIKRLCCDDDSSIRADCQWSNADYMKNNNTDVVPKVPISKGKNKGKLQDRADKGKLPAHVPEPLFVADPNHRRKVLVGELIKLDMSKVDDKFTMTRMDSTRLGKNFSYMARTLKHKDPNEYVAAGKACLEHHFDSHIYCGDWCKRKNETEQQKQSSIRYYRCKEKDAKLYEVLESKMARFVTQERLEEMAHTLDTNMNEAFNQICTWFAPKNKVFAGTGSLHTRIGFAVGINSLGVEVFFKRLFKKLGLPVTNNVSYYLNLKENNRNKRLSKVKTRDAKLNKNKRKIERLKKDTLVAKMERRKRLGTYRRGMNLDDPEEEVPEPARKKAAAVAKFCEYCGIKGHVTRRSTKCEAREATAKKFRTDGSLLSDPPPIGEPEALMDAAQAQLAEMDCEEMDAMPFNAEYESEDDDALTRFLLEDSNADGEPSIEFGNL